MRKLRLIYMVITLCLTTLLLVSCKNNLNYELCGFYVELVDIDTRSVEDNNPKIYFRKDNNNILATRVGSVGHTVAFGERGKVVDEETGKFMFTTTLNIPEEAFENIKIRLIIYQNGKYIIDKKVYKTIKTAGSCEYASKYTYKNKEYNVQFQLTIKIKE